MRRMLIFITAMLVASSVALAAQDAEKIGQAVVVENTVDLITADGAFEIVVGTDIATRQTITTGEKSSSQFTMRDDTRLAVGPNSQLLLDEFVYDPNPDKTKFVLTSLKGALRFVTGKNPSKTYTINTPTAVIGVRGTMFDIYINDQGDTIVGLLDGEVNVCPSGSRSRAGNCQDLQTAGRFLSIDRQGRIRKADRPDRTMLGNASFARAFPFLGGARRLRGKLAAPGKLRQQIRKKASLRSAPNRKIKRKTLKRKVLKRKASRRKAIRQQPPTGHRRIKNVGPKKSKYRSQQRKKKLKGKNKRRKKKGRRKKKAGQVRGGIYFQIPFPGGIFKPGRKKKTTLQ